MHRKTLLSAAIISCIAFSAHAQEAAKSANKNRKRGGRNRRGGSRSGGGNGGQGGQGGGQGRVVSKPSNGGGSPVQGLPRAI